MQHNYSPLFAAIEQTKTKNDCLTHETTDNPCVDLFFSINAARGMDEQTLFGLFSKAFDANAEDALKILFYSRDIRQGQGERNTFKVLIAKMTDQAAMRIALADNISKIPIYGRWDDLFAFIGTPLENNALACIRDALNRGDSLCAKWMPREKSSKKAIARKIMTAMNLSPKAYRKMLSRLTNVVETKMCSKDWDNIIFRSVPSLAMRNYRKAFEKNCTTWEPYISSLLSGEETVNASVLYPHDIVRKYFPLMNDWDLGVSNVDTLLEEQWKALPNYLNGENMILPVVDTSGSMYSGMSEDGFSPIIASLALGMYISERNKGPFKDHFVTFSVEPQVQQIEGNNLHEKLLALKKAEWGYNTDLSNVFNTILDSAVANNVDPKHMPTQILILSDMEFDRACSNGNSVTAYDYARTKYRQAGYNLPEIIFWNLNSSGKNNPVKFNETGTALVSGFSPVILKQILSSKELTPESIMRDVIDSERYSQISLPL